MKPIAFITAALCAASAASGGPDFAGFGPPTLLDIGGGVSGGPQSVRAGDLDADGDIDLVTPNTVGADSLSLLFNNGDGTFPPSVEIPFPLFYSPRDVAIADLDGDGIVDLAVAFAGGGPLGLAVFRGLGGGAFAEPTYFAAGGAQQAAIDAGDLDGDGDIDLILSNQLGGNVGVFLNRGDGTFAPPAFYRAGNVPARVVLADMDLDGDLDAVVVNAFSSDLTLLLNNGRGVFTSLPNVPTVLGLPRGLSIADLNGDDLPDVALPTADYDVLAVHWNLNGALSEPATLPIAVLAFVASAAAFSGDGLGAVDVALAGWVLVPGCQATGLCPARAELVLGDGRGGLTELPDLYPTGPDGSLAKSQCVADLDGDGDLDLAIAIAFDVAVLLNLTNTPAGPDLTGDGVVNGADLAELLRAWGGTGPADLNHDGVVDGADLANLLANWTSAAGVPPGSDFNSAK